ncbi:MAG TPA: hypothetical protein VEC36_05110 [Patescibacteria group bacterium]|nr:hypothetical protein [Patescibacteria group bacterium]
MKPANDLFLLIKSLHKGEKRFFKLYARKYEKDANYLRLFEAIDRQHEYDEQALKETFKNDKFAQRLSVTKEYLYEMILCSLRNYGTEVSPEMEVLALRRDIKTLISKRLYRQAEKLIVKAKELALQYDLFHELLGILGDEAYLPWKDREEMFREWRDVLDKFNNMYEFGYFAEQVRAITENKRYLRSPEDFAEINEIEKKYAKDVREATSFSSKLRYYFAHTMLNTLKNNGDEKLKNARATVGLFHEYPQFIQTQTLAYLSELRTYSAIELAQGNYEKALQSIQTLKQTEVPAQFLPFKKILLFFIEQNYALATLKFERFAEFELQYNELSGTYPHELASYGVAIELKFLSNFAYAYFAVGRYGDALKKLNILLARPDLAQHPYFENNVRLLYLIVHYEIGNFDLLEYLIRSTYRAFLKRKQLFAFEKCFLRHIRRLSVIDDTVALRRWLQALYDEIRVLSADPQEAAFLKKYNYPAWIESKLTGQKFLDVLKRKQESKRELKKAALPQPNIPSEFYRQTAE